MPTSIQPLSLLLLPAASCGANQLQALQRVLLRSQWAGQRMGRGKKRRGRPPLSFKLELEVLGIEVVDANVAVLTTTAVTVWEKQMRKSSVLSGAHCVQLYTSKRWNLLSQHPPKAKK